MGNKIPYEEAIAYLYGLYTDCINEGLDESTGKFALEMAIDALTDKQNKQDEKENIKEKNIKEINDKCKKLVDEAVEWTRLFGERI